MKARIGRRGALVLLGALAVAAASGARGEAVRFEGVEFAAEHGGLELRAGSGRGSLADPFVLYERITDRGPAILTVRNLDTAFGDPRHVGRSMGFVLKKVVTNATDAPWATFEMELREDLSKPSDYFDGLSFGQANDRRDYLGSDRFGRITLRDEPSDRIGFEGAVILPGETVELQIAITDHSPQHRFFLLQRRPIGLSATTPARRLTRRASPLSNAPDPGA